MHPSKILITISSAIFTFAATAWTGDANLVGVAVPEPDMVLERGKAVDLPAVDRQADTGLADVSSYDVYLGGLRLGKATIEVTRAGEYFVLQGGAKARSTINGMYLLSYNGHAKLLADPVQPTEAAIEEQKGSKTKTTLLKFPKPNLASAVQIETRPGREVKRTYKEYVSERLVLDPFSSIFFLRSHNWRVGEVQVFDILTGNKQYELQLTCRGKTIFTLEDKPRDAWEIVAQTRSVKPPRKIRLSGFVISLSRDSKREILKISGKYKIGNLVANLRTNNGQKNE